jgi:hypothetical protein
MRKVWLYKQANFNKLNNEIDPGGLLTVHIRILKFGIITSYQIISPEAKFNSYLCFTQISCDM